MSISILPLAQAGDGSARLISDLAEEVVTTSLPDLTGADRCGAVDRVRSFLADQPEGYLSVLAAGRDADPAEWSELAHLVTRETEATESDILVPTESDTCTSRESARKREFIKHKDSSGEGTKELCLNKLAPSRAPSHAADATHEDALEAAARHVRPIPAENMYHAKVQVFDNPRETDKGTSRQWKIKIYSSIRPEVGGENKQATHHVSFSTRTRDATKRVEKLADAGVISAQLAESFVDTSGSLHRGQLIGLVYQHARQKGTKGTSSNEHVYCGQYAVITLSQDGDKPVSVDLYLGADGEPLHLDKMALANSHTPPGQPRNPKAPGWVTEYDPTGSVTEVRREERARAKAKKRERTAVDFSPATELGRLMSDIAGAVAEAKQAPQAERLSALEDKIGRLQEDMQRVLDFLRI